MKVFIAHKDTDSYEAKTIAQTLSNVYGIDYYLDCFDEESFTANNITSHLREKLSECDSLLAVVSSKTRNSWWVPWEIGIATEKGHVIATYGLDYCQIPDYLKNWPYIRSSGDLGKFADELKSNRYQLNEVRSYRQDSKIEFANKIHKNLKRRLGQ